MRKIGGGQITIFALRTAKFGGMVGVCYGAGTIPIFPQQRRRFGNAQHHLVVGVADLVDASQACDLK